ncbi:hypothetical protein KTH_08050 [Thermosporothrix hazakensis]|jgi:hypothetical protein|nr:hypothetical protein KTH_08050 [Thermosporothrix hazakensis]
MGIRSRHQVFSLIKTVIGFCGTVIRDDAPEITLKRPAPVRERISLKAFPLLSPA